MAAQGGAVRYCQDGQTLRLRVEGWGTMKESLPVRRLVEKYLAGPAQEVRVDLCQCSYMDSTFLGTLLYLQRACNRKGTGRFHLIEPSSECVKLLQQMGVADIFAVTQADKKSALSWLPVATDPEDKDRFERNVFQAHEELAALPGQAGEPFRAVVRCMAKEMESKS